MPRFDLPPDQLRTYRPEVAEPADFDQFWAKTLAESRAAASEPVLQPVDARLRLVDVVDLTYSGFAGDPVRAWLVTPRGASEPLPTVVEFVGYGGGRGLPHEHLRWAAAGYAHLVMDTRGQGSGWSVGETPDPHGTPPSIPGMMTRGILDPHDHYYRRVFADAVRLVEVARTLPVVDADRLAVTGGSQGGGISLAVAGLVPGLLAVMPDVAFLCHFERAVGLTDHDPYDEVVRYLHTHRGHVEQVFTTLSYLDGVNFACRATANALFSVAFMDLTCPPSTVYAARNAWATRSGAEVEADIVEYLFNDHEGGQGVQFERQLEWLGRRTGLC